MEILTLDELCEWLKLSKSQAYTLTHSRSQIGPNPLPICWIGGVMRFRKQDVEKWLDRCAVEGAK